MPAGATFEVVIPPASGRFVHHAQPANTVDDATYLDHPLTDGKPDAVLSVTQNRNPGGGLGVYNDHLAGVLYDEGSGRWAARNLDGALMPAGAASNVAVSGGDGSTRQRRRRRSPSSSSSPPRTRSRRAPPGPYSPGPAGAARTASGGRRLAGRVTRAPPGHGGAREAAALRSSW